MSPVLYDSTHMTSSRDFAPAENATPVADAVTGLEDAHPAFDAEAIRDQVARILASPEFVKSHQLGRFLEFVVEETLAGRGDQIKQYTVAVKAFGRPAHFDPRADPIVRIEARRLRRSLNRYYQQYGAADPIIIDIPTGAYVPRFRWNERARISDDAASSLDEPRHSSAAVPTLVLSPFETLLNDEAQRFFADSLGEDLAIALHRFHHLHVIGPIPRAAEEVGPRTMARRYGADFLLAGRVIQSGDKMKIAVRLLNGDTGKLIWSETYSSQISDDPFEFGEEVVHRIAATLVDVYGVIPRTFLRRMAHEQGATYQVYSAILQYSRYLLSGVSQTGDEAVQALKEAAAIAPHNAMIKALLADLYIMKYQYGGDKIWLQQGEALAQEALRLDPKCQMAHFVIAFISYLHGKRETFIRQMREAVRHNPHNSLVLATAGVHLGAVGEWEEGFALTRRAMKLNPNFPGWFHTLDFLDAYRHERFEEALILAQKFNFPTFFFDPLIRAATLGQLGRKEEALQAWRELLALQPDFPTRSRDLLTRVLFSDELVDMLLEGLKKAGLEM